MDSRLAHPFTCIVFDPTSSAKFVFTLKLIKHDQEMISPPPERIIFCYGEYKKIFDNYPGAEFHDGLPKLSSFDGKTRTPLVMGEWEISLQKIVIIKKPFGSIFVAKSLLRKQTDAYVEFKFALHRPD